MTDDELEQSCFSPGGFCAPLYLDLYELQTTPVGSGPYEEPTRRELAAAALREARRRLREAWLVVTTGETSYEPSGGYDWP